jgi:PPOX class probable F420-dependent enzyme
MTTPSKTGSAGQQGGVNGQQGGVNQRGLITLDESEISEMLAGVRSLTVASVGPTGTPHLVAMWFAVVDGEIWFETKGKSQKAVNLRRDPRVSCLAEDGDVYEDLRGVEIEGHAEITDDADALWRVGVGLWERYHGQYSEEVRPFVEATVRKRVAVRIVPERVRSWDHRKLGMPSPAAAGGSTVVAPGRRRR